MSPLTIAALVLATPFVLYRLFVLWKERPSAPIPLNRRTFWPLAGFVAAVCATFVVLLILEIVLRPVVGEQFASLYLVAAVVVPVLYVPYFARIARRRCEGPCHWCGYDLRGSSAPSDLCPECGHSAQSWPPSAPAGRLLLIAALLVNSTVLFSGFADSGSFLLAPLWLWMLCVLELVLIGLLFVEIIRAVCRAARSNPPRP